ncbi:GNAT family N-acetyltransferase [Latilactobacillus curvatus]|uniref:GNAT family N-acetyltransferase n=1 Tax=Latilactobacillus curvatus TaxID=28038 RepID=UPI0020A4A91E|nr:GNAT family protein [Latilactobacillus curvatus]MCT3532814.1 N-acetyltransferase [Latilactobacillus curvatus]UTC14179.1 hypothetical protein A4W80_04255 [Latilactobacillus curvatus]
MQPKLVVDQHIHLQPVTEADAPALFQLVDQNRVNLDTWLPWVGDIESVADELGFLKYAQQQMANQELWMATIWDDHQLVGTIDVHNIDDLNRAGEVGYWLDEAFRGRGVMHRALAAIEQYAASELELDQLSIIATHENVASQQVALKAGYRAVETVSGVTSVSHQPQDATRYQKQLGGM